MSPLVALLLAAHLMRVEAAQVWPVVADGGFDYAGVIARGAVVELTGCDDGGVVASLLEGRAQAGCAAFAPTDAGEPSAGLPQLRWGAVRKELTVREAPARDARALSLLTAPYTVALIDEPQAFAHGWAERAAGGWVSLADVRLARPSTFAGVQDPALPLAFALRGGPLAVEAFDASTVKTARGSLPRSAVRLAVPRDRPAGVPEGARWIHVEFSEQVLTAYQGDAPVYATRISSGAADLPEHRTRPGLFRVWLKALHDRMHGEGYFVEEVPFIMFFHGGQAMHGTFWHDRFGDPVSHGCVNLSMTDAQWLFEWAPPQLPPGWHSIAPGAVRDETLWVQIERSPPRAPWPRTQIVRAVSGQGALAQPMLR